MATTEISDDNVRLLADHLERRPFMRLQDMYKARHQGAWGPGYQVTDKDRAWRSFQGEWNQADKLSGDPVIEILSSRFVRVNLGPYKRKNFNAGDLFSAWLSGTISRPDGEVVMVQLYQALVAGVHQKHIPFDLGEVEEFEEKMRDLRYPSLSHSDPYIQQYRPHYRVVLQAVLPIPVEPNIY
ncbi:MAG: hypothetical protein FJZ01_07185 [Candidatus Sericytochromatia bacterium]|nr:hypothetical protein [Candidatus Tanganyikabacteria bacterium]